MDLCKLAMALGIDPDDYEIRRYGEWGMDKEEAAALKDKKLENAIIEKISDLADTVEHIHRAMKTISRSYYDIEDY